MNKFIALPEVKMVMGNIKFAAKTVKPTLAAPVKKEEEKKVPKVSAT